MALHPDAGKYRQALAAGDHTGAAGILMAAHSGPYSSALIDQFHEVSRMTRDQLSAPADLEPVRARNIGVVNNVYVNGGGS